MILAVGSKNLVKIQALEELIPNYPELAGSTILSFNVSSEVSDQPMSIEEIIAGAKNRARNAYKNCSNCTYSFGIESGIFQAKGTNTGFLETCICAIYDGTNYYIGHSCGFEIPAKILKFVLEDKMDLSQACRASGITNNVNIGSSEGLIGILSKGYINRKEYTKQAIATALMQIQSAEWYKL